MLVDYSANLGSKALNNIAPMTQDFPRTIDEMNSEWLSESFDAEVRSFEVSPLEGGVLSDAHRITDIQYVDKATAPSSAVLKLANSNEDQRAYAISANVYKKELNFFEQLADEVPLRTPVIYNIKRDSQAEFFAILMEDLSTHSLVFDQVNDAPDEAFTRKINLEAAALHARYWDSPTLELDWIGQPGGGYVFPLADSCRDAPKNRADYEQMWQAAVGVTPFSDYTKALADIITGPKCNDLMDYMTQIISSRTQTLTHGDMRADNIFRSRDKNVDDALLTYIDWQLVSSGTPGPEFAQAWQHTLPPEVRRKDLDFLRQYHNRLLELQPKAASYDYDMLVEDYKISMVMWFMALISLAVATIPSFDQPGGERMQALWVQGLRLMSIAVKDHDCLDMLKQFEAEIG